MVDVLGCLGDDIRLHLYGLPWPAGTPATRYHSDAEGAIVRLAAKWKVGYSCMRPCTASDVAIP